MTFTDDDLKRLKEDIKTIDDFNGMRMFSDTLIPLLARLEAAEAILVNLRTHALTTCLDCEADYKVWRKAAGK